MWPFFSSSSMQWSCPSSSGSHHTVSMPCHNVVVSTMVHLGPLVDYIHLVYHVSPPGDKRARMAGMKLQFQFQGKEDRKLKVWWNCSWKYQNCYSYHKFGLGAVKVMHGIKAFDADFLAQVSGISTSNTVLICIRSQSQIWSLLAYWLTTVGLNTLSTVTTYWVGASMFTSLLNFHAVVCSALVCLLRWTRKTQRRTRALSEQEQLLAIDLESEVEDTLRVPLDKYLEGEYLDLDDSWSDPHCSQNFLDGETLEEYYEHWVNVSMLPAFLFVFWSMFVCSCKVLPDVILLLCIV